MKKVIRDAAGWEAAVVRLNVNLKVAESPRLVDVQHLLSP
jgi:hypothetical protein